MMREQDNLRRRDAATQPSTYGRTLVATAPDPHALLRNLIDAWSVIAGWGRWSDDDLGDWPPAAEMVAQLPEPLRARWRERPAEEVESWLDDLNERGWVWWASTVDDELRDRFGIDRHDVFWEGYSSLQALHRQHPELGSLDSLRALRPE